MRGFRKFVYSIVFSFLVLVAVIVLKLQSQILNEWEMWVFVAILFAFPMFNVLEHLAEKITDEKVLKNIDKLTGLFGKKKDED